MKDFDRHSIKADHEFKFIVHDRQSTLPQSVLTEEYPDVTILVLSGRSAKQSDKLRMSNYISFVASKKRNTEPRAQKIEGLTAGLSVVVRRKTQKASMNEKRGYNADITSRDEPNE